MRLRLLIATICLALLTVGLAVHLEYLLRPPTGRHGVHVAGELE